MTYKEALKALDETVIGNLELKIILSRAVEKQIPKKPYDFDSFPRNRCPACYYSVRLYSHGMKSKCCPWCGQALDWSGIE